MTEAPGQRQATEMEAAVMWNRPAGNPSTGLMMWYASSPNGPIELPQTACDSIIALAIMLGRCKSVNDPTSLGEKGGSEL